MNTQSNAVNAVDRTAEIAQACQYIGNIASKNHNRNGDADDIVSIVKIKLLTNWQPGKGYSAKSFAVMAYKQSRAELAVERAALSCSVGTYNNRLAAGIEEFGNSLQANSLDAAFDSGDGDEDSLQSVVAEAVAENPAEFAERRDMLQTLRAQLVAMRGMGESESRALHVVKLRYIHGLNLADCGRRLNVSGEYVRQLEVKGLNILRAKMGKVTK